MNAVALDGGSLRYRPFAALLSGSDFAAREPTLPLAVDIVWHGLGGTGLAEADIFGTFSFLKSR